MLFSYLANVLREGTRESFGRVVSLPFLVSSWALLTTGGVIEIVQNTSAPLDTAGTLALIGFALYTGSKMLSLRGSKGTISTGPGEPDAPEKKATPARAEAVDEPA